MHLHSVRTTILSLVLIVIVGCGGTKHAGITPPATKAVIESAPKWFLDPPKDDDYISGAGTATSRDMQLAKDKAAETARFEVAKAIETRYEAISKRFQEEVGTALDAQYLDQFTQATKAVVSQVLTGVTVDKVSISEESGVFRSYALVKLPLGAASEALMKRIKEQDQLYTRFRSTEVYNELDKDVQRFEEWKKGQNP